MFRWIMDRLDSRSIVPGAKHVRQWDGYYGGGMTIHQTGHVDVELDKNGKVVSVWFRCALLPFTQTVVSDERAREMDQSYLCENPPDTIAGIQFDRSWAETEPISTKH